ncbi:uncharacterized protein G2W53_041512 [Senna tora]|uniref:Uncharacterized protein n=1 Tax=Senna tora TaxID=362788 RepID=A0A834W1H5_9FABA|nr:uncharacterized protein G2W53_041512 [Senna tora]
MTAPIRRKPAMAMHKRCFPFRFGA